jgi:hypothetical protein
MISNEFRASEIERVTRTLCNKLQEISKWPAYPYSNNAVITAEDMQEIYRKALVNVVEFNETHN